MGKINVDQENSTPIDLYYEDHGSGQPIVLIHGYPLSGTSWERQALPLLKEGYRVITYDRRGFGESSKPTTGYDYDTFTEDLNKIMTKLDLKNAVLVGFSMGSGEVIRYLSKFGSKRVSKAVFLSGIPPYLLKTADNPQGVDGKVFEGISKAIIEDRFAYLTQFFYNFYNLDVYGGNKVSEEFVRYSWNVASKASAKGTLDCVKTWLTDFRNDISSITIPTLMIHGDADRILPFESTGDRFHKLVKGSRFVLIKGAPHALIWTHADIVNKELLNFIRLPA